MSRAHTGKCILSPTKNLELEKDIAHPLGMVRQLLSSRTMDENDISNADEAEFIIMMDNGRTIGFSGETYVQYADDVSWVEGMAILVRPSGGKTSQYRPHS